MRRCMRCEAALCQWRAAAGGGGGCSAPARAQLHRSGGADEGGGDIYAAVADAHDHHAPALEALGFLVSAGA
jgi:hypothetical protein